MRFKEVLDELKGWFDSQSFPFAVIGGLALHAYGISRLTHDLDLITVAEAQDGTVRFLESLGYQTLHRSQGFSNHQHSEPGRGRVDVLYIRGDTAERLFREAERRTLFDDVEVLVPRPEHLVALKLHAFKSDRERVQDLSDLRALLRLPGIDREELADIFVKRGEKELYERLQEPD